MLLQGEYIIISHDSSMVRLPNFITKKIFFQSFINEQILKLLPENSLLNSNISLWENSKEQCNNHWSNIVRRLLAVSMASLLCAHQEEHSRIKNTDASPLPVFTELPFLTKYWTPLRTQFGNPSKSGLVSPSGLPTCPRSPIRNS